MNIEQLINFARSKNASDIHLTVGAPTSIRINGELKKFDGMDEEVVSRTILSMLSAAAPAIRQRSITKANIIYM